MAMPVTIKEFHSDNFQKEQILRRLRNRVIQLWGLQETEIDQLDPIVDLLLGACSVEFEKTAQEINTSQARVLEKLAHLMVPEVFTNAKPAHGILHVQADLPVSTLNIEDQFSLEKETQEGSKSFKSSLIFSPVIPTKIFDASVICQASGSKITFYENPISKGENIQADGGKELSPFCFWIGLKVNARIEDLKGLTLYFDWKNEPDKSKFTPLLSQAILTLEGNLLDFHTGLDTPNSKNILSEFDEMTELENHILYLYHHQYLTISDTNVLPVPRNYPLGFEGVFSEDKLKKIKDELLWIKIRMPEGMSPQSIYDVYCSVNCLPVMNRTIHTSNRPYALTSRLNSIPLSTDNYFLTVKKVHSASREYRSVSLKKIREVEDGTYSLRQGGIARFDQRDANAMLNNLFDMLRDESAAFSSFGNFALASEIKSMEQILTRLQMHFAQKATHPSSKSHLLIYSKNAEDVYVEFWSTQGELANRIPTGKKPEMLTQGNIKKESMVLVNPTSGGKEPMNEVEKLHAYKYTLMTRSRIVTEEDMKALCYSELGEKIQGVQIKKGVMKDLTVQKGFVRTLDVVLKPSENFQQSDWANACRELQGLLERKKMFLTAIRVFMELDQTPYVA